MPKQEFRQKLLTYAVCMAAIILDAIILTFAFHCPFGWKILLWVALAAIGLSLLLPMKRFNFIVPLLTAIYLSASLLCCTYVEPYFIKEALASEGSPYAKGNVWMAAWVLLSLGVIYMMVHLLTGLMDRLSPNEALFDEDAPLAVRNTPKRRAVLATVLSVAVVAVGIFSAATYHRNVMDIPLKATQSEENYVTVMPNLRGKLGDEATNTAGYVGDYQVHYHALEKIPVSEFVHAGQSVNGSALQVDVILRHKDHDFDPAINAEILKIEVFDFGWLGGLVATPSDAETEELIAAIVRGEPTVDPVSVVYPTDIGYAKVTFKELDGLWWEARIMSKDGAYYLRVATHTDFSVKNQRYDPQYVFYPLPIDEGSSQIAADTKTPC